MESLSAGGSLGDKKILIFLKATNSNEEKRDSESDRKLQKNDKKNSICIPGKHAR